MMKTWTWIAFATLIAISSAEEKKESVNKETKATKRSLYGGHYSYSGLATPVILDTTTGSGYSSSGHSLVSNYGHGVVLDSYGNAFGNAVSYGGGYGTTNTQTKHVPVILQQYPVQFTKTVAVPQSYPVKVSVPVEVPKSYVFKVTNPVQVKTHPVTVTKNVQVPVERPHYVKVPQQVPVAVNQQYPVAVPQTVVVPGVVGVSGLQYGSVSGGGYTSGDLNSGTGYGEIVTGFPSGTGFVSGTDYGMVISSGISSGPQIGSQIVSGSDSGSGSGSAGTGYRKEFLNAYLPPSGGYSGYNSYTTKWKHV